MDRKEKLEAALALIEEVQEEYFAEMGWRAQLELGDGGAEPVLYANRAALLYVCQRVIANVRYGVEYTHDTFDEYDIFEPSEGSLTISLKDQFETIN